MLELRTNKKTIDNESAFNSLKQYFISHIEKGILLSAEQALKDWILFNDKENYEEECLKNNFTLYYNNIVHLDALKNILPLEYEEIFFLESGVWSQKSNTKTFLSYQPYQANDFKLVIQILTLKHKQIWNQSNPFVSFVIHDFGLKHRATALAENCFADNQCKLFLRKIEKEIWPIASYGENETVEDIKDFIYQKKNLLLVGSTGSGKTSFLSSLIQFISPKEHLIILEDTEEIECTHPICSRFIQNEHNSKQKLHHYCSYSLRMTPDRLIVGELRSNEVVPFLLTANSGHRGLISTVHANSCIDAIERLALLFSIYSNEVSIPFEQIKKMICQGIDYIIFMENKKISEIIKLKNYDKGEIFFECIYSQRISFL